MPEVVPSHLQDLEAIAGVDAVQPGSGEWEIGGEIPGAIVAPRTARDLAAVLAWADSKRLSVVPCGGGTKMRWGREPAGIDLILSTHRLNVAIEHRHGDLTATVDAGATLTEVNRELARFSQWIPLDPGWPDRATIGGIIATNDSGPRRLRHGAPRDLLIGIEFARADGHLAKAGGIVVKNVAGYDLSKLLAGSFGTLAVIVRASFKLAPLPAASRTVVIEVLDVEALGPMTRAFTGSQLSASAIELELPPLRLLVRFESLEAVAAAQAEEAVGIAERHDGRARVVNGTEEQELWRAHAARPWDEHGAVLKLGMLPTDVSIVLTAIQSYMRPERVQGEIVGRAGLGVLYLRLDGSPEVQQRVIGQIRERLAPINGYGILLRGGRELKQLIDPWGPLGDGLKIMQAVKRSFDPHGILSPGRGPA